MLQDAALAGCSLTITCGRGALHWHQFFNGKATKISENLVRVFVSIYQIDSSTNCFGTIL